MAVAEFTKDELIVIQSCLVHEQMNMADQFPLTLGSHASQFQRHKIIERLRDKVWKLVDKKRRKK